MLGGHVKSLKRGSAGHVVGLAVFIVEISTLIVGSAMLFRRASDRA